MKITSKLLLGALSFGASLTLATAQDPATPAPQNRGDRGNRGGNNAGAPGGDRGGRGNFNMDELRKRMSDGLKTSLKATDEEWAVIQPLLEKVTNAQRDTMMGRFSGMMGGFRGSRDGAQGGSQGGSGGGAPTDRPERAGSKESEALRAALASDNSTPEDIKNKLNAVRDSRKKAAAELAQSREELRKVLTVRQEAVLVSMGVLE